MDQLTRQLHERILEVRHQLMEARLCGDDYLVDIQSGVLEELTRIARENDIDLAALEPPAA